MKALLITAISILASISFAQNITGRTVLDGEVLNVKSEIRLTSSGDADSENSKVTLSTKDGSSFVFHEVTVKAEGVYQAINRKESMALSLVVNKQKLSELSSQVDCFNQKTIAVLVLLYRVPAQRLSVLCVEK
jgi:hypothetical protein